MKNDFYSRVFRGESSKDTKGNNEKRYDENSFDKGFEEKAYRNAGDTEDIKEAKRSFSRIGLSLSAFSVISYGVILATYLLVMIFFGEKAEQILSNVWFSWCANVVSMYLIAFPVLYLILKNMKRTERPKSKLYPSELFRVFLVSEAVMLVGNLIGVNLNSLISSLMGHEVTNGVEELITASPIWLITLVAVIVGPIVEELIFRRLIIDRLSVFGDLTAVIVSASLFGLFHGNLYQFFYATGLGVVLGYVYVRTRNLIYPIIIHMLVNFTGSVVAIFINELAAELEIMSQTISAGGEVDMGHYLLASGIILAYAALQYGMAIAGGIILYKKIRSHDVYISSRSEVNLGIKSTALAALCNLGIILFVIISLLQMGANLFV